MELVDASTAEAYLRRTGRLAPGDQVQIERLAGGVSNEVLRVTRRDGSGDSSFVVKQARAQLRVPQPWFCTVERIWRETATLAACQPLAQPGQVPRILFEDRENYLFAMTAAPRDHRTWKHDLLAGVVDLEVADQCGRLLGAIHAGSWRDARIAREFADRQLFDELRLDPYYRTVARQVPEAAQAFAQLIDSIAANCCALVHADFSPKNILLFPGGLLLVDYETGHYGDPAFDLGFFFSHLCLKTYYHAPQSAAILAAVQVAWDAYRREVEPRIPAADWRALSARWTRHLGGCLWARLDGKSQVEYLTAPPRREFARALARALLFQPTDGPSAIQQLEASLVDGWNA